MADDDLSATDHLTPSPLKPEEPDNYVTRVVDDHLDSFRRSHREGTSDGGRNRLPIKCPNCPQPTPRQRYVWLVFGQLDPREPNANRYVNWPTHDGIPNTRN